MAIMKPQCFVAQIRLVLMKASEEFDDGSCDAEPQEGQKAVSDFVVLECFQT